MTSHHTKDKGDLGVAKAFADLVGQGFDVLFPATEHAPFDLVAYADERFIRVQVKYRAAHPDGYIRVQFTTNWSDRQGVHRRFFDGAETDIFCVYCPDTDRCYYVDPRGFGRYTVTLRLRPPRSNQRRGVSFADDFVRIPREPAERTLWSPPDSGP